MFRYFETKVFFFKISPELYQKELSIIATNFSSFITQLIPLSEDTTNLDLFELILSQNSLKLENEDELLNFVMELCSKDENYQSLFKFVWLEYCSFDSIKKFFDFIKTIFIKSNKENIIFDCLGRRLLQQKLPIDEKYVRYIKEKIDSNQNNEGDINSLQGILYKENLNGNVILESSDTSHNVYNILKCQDNHSKSCPKKIPKNFRYPPQ